uniref:Phosphoribosylamine--glycine ligase n=1 Tax=uncultured marine thaumarchaeote AD1000_80_F03 TaxID=1455943 RepID=A0A075FZF4_9ARCH|nr:phosphoribosylamine--glycine ligase (purD) [uncultured marine thaumarchaeote AD1000_80_F03]
MVNVLVIGSGGREHAIGWKLGQSDNVNTVFHAPGNGGTLNNVPISVDNLGELAKFASENNCFTVVGPEAPLAMGIVDMFNEMGLKIFGPTKKAAQLESSKIWAKQFLKRNNIPTAAFEVFDDAVKAKEYVKQIEHNVVIKADGLAAGKGVIVCDSKAEAEKSIDMMLVDKKFGDAGNNIIIEERIDGIEASYIALSDGKIAIPMATSQDHKRIFDNDKGPNTGGMGAYSPTPIIDKDLSQKIQEKIIDKTISSLRNEGITFKGFLYAGIMLKDGEPYVLEYNVRMGDPECQPILMRMDSDLFEYLVGSVEGTLENKSLISWKNKSAVCIVLASKGYPESYPKGEEIFGLGNAFDDACIFHAGTKELDKKIITNGGRVLGVTALGDTLEAAIKHAYDVTEKISWENKYLRTDIGKKGLSHL